MANLEHFQLPWAKYLGNKDLGALLQLQTFVLLDANVEARSQRVGLTLKIYGPTFDGVDKEEGNFLIFFRSRVSVLCKPGEESEGPATYETQVLTSTTLSTLRRTLATGAPTNGTCWRMPALPIRMLSRSWWTRTNCERLV